MPSWRSIHTDSIPTPSLDHPSVEPVERLIVDGEPPVDTSVAQGLEQDGMGS